MVTDVEKPVHGACHTRFLADWQRARRGAVETWPPSAMLAKGGAPNETNHSPIHRDFADGQPNEGARIHAQNDV
jgi:hypothetical protein